MSSDIKTPFSFFTHPTMLRALGGKQKFSIWFRVTALLMKMGKHDFCCAPGCSNSRKTRGDLQFYRIPKDINRRRIWLKRIRRKNFMPTENTRLCSEHFLGGQKSDDVHSVSYNPSIFKHSHVKPKLTRSTKTSLATTRVSNSLPHVRRKSRKPVRSILCFDEGTFHFTFLV